MPPPNEQRRAELADAAIAVLAERGTKGLTHRAVDEAAGVPPGTTSRYFRTRDALFTGVVDRASRLQFASMTLPTEISLSPQGIADELVRMIRQALTVDRARHLAINELFLEGTRRPELRATLADTMTALLRMLQEMFRAAGIELATPDARLLLTFFNGQVVTMLTVPPEALDLADVEESLRQVRTMVEIVLARAG